MQKILLSMAVIVAVGGAVAASTGAFFSDTQTSTGNTFAAGSMVLNVDDAQHYAGLVCHVGPTPSSPYTWQQDPSIGPNPTTRPDLLGQPCTGFWVAGPLGPSKQFFNFTDLKPGDQGENTISLHVSNNAWACLNIGTNADNGLAPNVTVFAWNDNGATGSSTPGDNIYSPQNGDRQLFGGNGLVTLSSFGATTTIPLADSTHGSQLLASTTNYIGVAWCFGSTTVNNSNGAITCDGSGVGNSAQNTSATSTVQFYVVQSRNNPNFTCPTSTNPIT